MNRYHLCLGSNIDPAKHIPETIETLKKTFHVTAVSNIYETNPVGPSGDRKFWNAVLTVESELDRKQICDVLKVIEAKHGRVRDPENKFSPRTIDIDIVPGKDDMAHAFIMKPLAEVAPDERDKSSDRSYAEIASTLEAQSRDFRKMNPVR